MPVRKYFAATDPLLVKAFAIANVALRKYQDIENNSETPGISLRDAIRLTELMIRVEATARKAMEGRQEAASDGREVIDYNRLEAEELRTLELIMSEATGK